MKYQIFSVFRKIVFTAFEIGCLIYFVVAGCWLMYPYEPLVVKRQPIEIMNPGKQVQAGSFLVYKIEWEKKMDVTGTLAGRSSIHTRWTWKMPTQLSISEQELPSSR